MGETWRGGDTHGCVIEGVEFRREVVEVADRNLWLCSAHDERWQQQTEQPGQEHSHSEARGHGDRLIRQPLRMYI